MLLNNVVEGFSRFYDLTAIRYENGMYCTTTYETLDVKSMCKDNDILTVSI